MTRPTPRRRARPVRGPVPPSERYREALRLGHIATVRGQLDEALARYGEAASIAPDRSLPRTSAGIALARAGRHDAALAQFEAALRLAPHDEASTLGRAESLAEVGRWGEAAAGFDEVADVREADGRLVDALVAASRALELAESRLRRRQVETLVARVLEANPDERARAVLGSALRVLEPAPGAPAGSRTGEPGEAEPAPVLAPEAEPAPEPAGRAGAPAPVPEPEEPALDVVAAMLDADVALDTGDHSAARERLLVLAASLDRSGRGDAALDACYRALAVAPDDAELHLLLARLYAGRGWDALATEKLDLLERLAALDNDESAIADVEAARVRMTPST